MSFILDAGSGVLTWDAVLASTSRVAFFTSPVSAEDLLVRFTLVCLGRLFALARGRRLDPRRPSVREALVLANRYYRQPGNGAWGSLHAVLDDGNVEDSFVRGTIDWAIDRRDVEGAALAILLFWLSKTQRLEVSRRAR